MRQSDRKCRRESSRPDWDIRTVQVRRIGLQPRRRSRLGQTGSLSYETNMPTTKRGHVGVQLAESPLTGRSWHRSAGDGSRPRGCTPRGRWCRAAHRRRPSSHMFGSCGNRQGHRAAGGRLRWAPGTPGVRQVRSMSLSRRQQPGAVMAQAFSVFSVHAADESLIQSEQAAKSIRGLRGSTGRCRSLSGSLLTSSMMRA